MHFVIVPRILVCFVEFRLNYRQAIVGYDSCMNIEDSSKKPLSRLDLEFAALNSVREMIFLATDGDPRKSNYVNSMLFGAELLPLLLGEDSLLRRSVESDEVKFYRQKAISKSSIEQEEISPVELIDADINELVSLIKVGKNQEETSKLKKRHARLSIARDTLEPKPHTEHQMIIRDAEIARPGPPLPTVGRSRLFEMDSGNLINVRTLHPDQPEEKTGVDLIYERHDVVNRRVNIVAIQYKVWNDKKLLYLNEGNLRDQIDRMIAFFCDQGICESRESRDHDYRFPYCSAFLRPTDRLQSADHRLQTSGERIPVCKIKELTGSGKHGAEVLRLSDIRELSLNHMVFQDLFDRRKIGSRTVSYDELDVFYEELNGFESIDRVILHAQSYRKSPRGDW